MRKCHSKIMRISEFAAFKCCILDSSYSTVHKTQEATNGLIRVLTSKQRCITQQITVRADLFLDSNHGPEQDFINTKQKLLLVVFRQKVDIGFQVRILYAVTFSSKEMFTGFYTFVNMRCDFSFMNFSPFQTIQTNLI